MFNVNHFQIFKITGFYTRLKIVQKKKRSKKSERFLKHS
jgi:hypothetical protein